MGLPIHEFLAGLWWLLTAFLLGFGWAAGHWLAAKILR